MNKICCLHLMALFAITFGIPAFAQDPEQPAKPEAPAAKKEKRRKDEVLRIEGAITAKSTPDKFRGNDFFCNVHETRLSPEFTYVIEIASKDPVAMNLDVRLETAKRANITNTQDRLQFQPEEEEVFRIVASSRLGGATGKYTLSVLPMPRRAISPLIPPVVIDDVAIIPLAVSGLNPNTTNQSTETHGYIEYPFLIENNSETASHKVKLTMPRVRQSRYGHSLHAMSKTVEIGPGASVTISLWQPDLSMAHWNDAEVEIDGRSSERGVPIQIFSNRGGRFNNYYFGGPRGGGFCYVLVAGDPLQQQLRNAVQRSAVGVATRPPTGGGGYSSTGGQHSELGPYYGKSYTYYDIHRFQPGHVSLQAWSRHWLGYSSFDGVAVTGEQLKAAPAEVLAALWQYVECGGTMLILGKCKLPEHWDRTLTEVLDLPVYYPGFGQCIMVPKTDPNKWDPDQWRVITGMWEGHQNAWQQIRTPTDAHREFEVVKDLTIPVRGLFVAMLLFVVVIGPFNIYWLSRSKRRIWLLWTVPAFSVLTCLLLVGYMVATEGWHGHIRAQGITILDEATQRATTIGWNGYYCPTTPGGGLHFSLDTELTPHLVTHRGGSGMMRHTYSIDWTHEQHLYDGWVTAKVPVYFMTRRSEKRLERLTVRKTNDGALAVVNGLGADIKTLALAGAGGKIYQAADIRAGAEAVLQATENSAPNKLELLNKAFRESWVKSAEALAKNPEEFLRAGCYVAVLDDGPFLEPGLNNPQSRRLESIVYGILKDAP